jgi:hypothetical protein
MILPLRQRHRRMFSVLAVALPVALVLGIAARRPVPTSASLPGGISGEPRRFPASQWTRDDLFTKIPIHVALVRERIDSGQFAVELSAPRNFARPDLLVYWIVGSSTVPDAVPDNAVLLGSFTSSLPLPFSTSQSPSNGMLILYSLADHEVVDVSKSISF